MKNLKIVSVGFPTKSEEYDKETNTFKPAINYWMEFNLDDNSYAAEFRAHDDTLVRCYRRNKDGSETFVKVSEITLVEIVNKIGEYNKPEETI